MVRDIFSVYMQIFVPAIGAGTSLPPPLPFPEVFEKGKPAQKAEISPARKKKSDARALGLAIQAMATRGLRRRNFAALALHLTFASAPLPGELFRSFLLAFGAPGQPVALWPAVGGRPLASPQGKRSIPLPKTNIYNDSSTSRSY